MESHKELSPHQGLPDEGKAVPSGGTQTRDGTPASVAPSNSMPTASKRQSSKRSGNDQLNWLRGACDEIVADQSTDELDWPILLRAKLSTAEIHFSDQDIRRYLRQAKQRRDGRKDILPAGEFIDLREDEWLWHGVIMRQATNMIFAHPKVGKTRLMLAMLAEFSKGRGEFAGIGLTPGDEKLLILGPDQSKRSWGNYLNQVGLLDDKQCLAPELVGLVTAEESFCLDEYWLSRVELALKEHGPLVVMLDSYSASIRGLGLDENKPEATVPMQQLHNLVMGHDSTLIVIHHSNKAGGDGDLSTMSRGSSAIAAAADNLIGMKRWKEDTDDGVKKFELMVTGRAETDGTPLIGFAKHSGEWMSCGSVSEAKSESQKDEAYDGLTVFQLSVLEQLCRSLKDGNKPLQVQELVKRLVEKPTPTARVKISKTLTRLQTLGFAEIAPKATGAPPQAANRWQPTGWAVVKHSASTLYPDI